MKVKLLAFIVFCAMYGSSYAQSDSITIEPHAVQYKKVTYSGNTTYETYQNPNNLAVGTE